MLVNDSPTLIDTSVADRPTTVISDDGGLIGGRYRLLRPLGEGGMGNVYLATDLVLARQVAVKTVRPELSGNEEVRSRIKRECRLHAAIGTHPHIVTLYDTVEENGHLYLVMEYFAGETLASRLAAAGSRGLPLTQTLDIVRQILLALSCIHSRDIVHRDIKTANILLQEQPEGLYLAKLTDFGIARAEVEPGAMTCLTSLEVQGPGTPVYMAPERIDPGIFGEVCPASDLYAVGIILFELLTGQPPFTGTITEIFSGHLVQPPALEALPAGLPSRLPAILRTVLAKQPGERYQQTEGFLAALAELDVQKPHLPGPVAVQDTTLLAVDDGNPAQASPGVTVLDSGQGRPRERSRPASLPRRWFYAAAVVVIVLVGYLVHSQQAGPPKPSQDAVETSAGTAITPQNQAAAVLIADPSVDQTLPKVGSALEVVEQARQQKKSESMTTARSEWQVTENRTRKIH
jgi:serine/threonine-protein kinase